MSIEPAKRVTRSFASCRLCFADSVVAEAELDRLSRRQRKTETEEHKLAAKLANAQFASNAPPEIVAKDHQRLEELRTEIAQLSAQTARVNKLKNQ